MWGDNAYDFVCSVCGQGTEHLRQHVKVSAPVLSKFNVVHPVNAVPPCAFPSQLTRVAVSAAPRLGLLPFTWACSISLFHKAARCAPTHACLAHNLHAGVALAVRHSTLCTLQQQQKASAKWVTADSLTDYIESNWDTLCPGVAKPLRRFTPAVTALLDKHPSKFACRASGTGVRTPLAV